MDNARLLLLIERALNDALSVAERNELQELLADMSEEDAVIRILEHQWASFEPRNPVFSEDQGRAILQKVLDGDHDNRSSKGRLRVLLPWFKVVAAALVAVAAWVTIAHYSSSRNAPKLTIKQAVERSGIEPGTLKATIVLANGKEMTDDDSSQGIVSKAGEMYVYNSENGRIVYEVTSDEVNTGKYHTVVVPKGGHYHVQLEDGTKIHLNAASSLRFPIRFTNQVRAVELTGEGFFEVAADAKRPFLVKTQQQTVRVLGTTFTIRAYPSLGNVKTTLIDGAVEVIRDDHTALLKPGEAAISRLGERAVYVEKTNIEEALAWHKNHFLFDNESIKDIMDRVGRWYDVEIDYKGNLDNIRLGGIFHRSKSIVRLLESFEATGLVTFTIEGRRVTVARKKNS